MLVFVPRVTKTGGEHYSLQTDGVDQRRTRGREMIPLSGDQFGRRQSRAPCTLGGVDQVCVARSRSVVDEIVEKKCSRSCVKPRPKASTKD